MKDARVGDGLYLKRGAGGLLRVGTAGRRRPAQPSPTCREGCPLSAAPPVGAPRPPLDTGPGLPAIAALQLPMHSVPGAQTPVRAGTRPERVDRPTGPTGAIVRPETPSPTQQSSWRAQGPRLNSEHVHTDRTQPGWPGLAQSGCPSPPRQGHQAEQSHIPKKAWLRSLP